VGGVKPIAASDIRDFQIQQAGRIRKFLKRLAANDRLLIRYINDRVVVLQDEVKAKRLATEDVALLLDSDYSHVYEVMSQGSEPMRWIVIWIV
jgi:hypothetical protein